MYKSGFVSVIGRPNVGKSTLLNNIIGEKISIVSDKPQTTRNKIHLIYNDDDSQVIFLDTPGIQNPKNKLGEYMLQVSKETLNEVDVVTFIVDDSMKIGKMDNYILDQLKEVESPIVLIINKTDLMEKDQVAELIVKYDAMDLFEHIIPMSALSNYNTDEYLKVVREMLPEGPQYFPDDMITDQPERFIIAEIIREKALMNLEQEVPHGIFVYPDQIKKREDRDLIDVHATIFCERESQKGIIIGKRGSMLKKIGTEARVEIENLMGSKINLQIWVKVEKNWRDKKAQVEKFGYI